MTSPNDATIAYFSMEIVLEADLPTYSGGLGVLAGDFLRAAADLSVPIVGMTLVHRRGYFHQHLDAHGEQSETPATWSPESHLESLPYRVAITLESRTVWVRGWRYRVRGLTGHEVPVYLLDTDVDGNSEWDRHLTDTLYGGDEHYRLCQEVILGVGGAEFLEAAGHDQITTFHMNEGHSALLVLGLIEEHAGGKIPDRMTEELRETVRHRCVFTTHTPVPAGQDKFSADLVYRVLGEPAARLVLSQSNSAQLLNMTELALNFSRYINGVGMRHGQLSRGMFPGYPINSITNGVHAVTWAADPFRALYDRHIPEWRRDNLYLRYAVGIGSGEILAAHAECKRRLFDEVQKRTGVSLNPTTLTFGFARRAAMYKRADLLFTDIERLRRIAQRVGALQIVYSGKAHPMDGGGKEQIRKVFEAAAALKGDITVVYLEEYDVNLARLMCAGTDVWLNTPLKPQEASGTSGMKAAINGVPSFSILDGWWIEGCMEGLTGWAIGEDGGKPSDPAQEADSLYEKLEYVIAPLFYRNPLAFAEVMRGAIALNGSYYNSQRMMIQYVSNAYAISSEHVKCTRQRSM